MVSVLKAKLWKWFKISISGLWFALPGQLVHGCSGWVLHGTEYRVQLSATERQAKYREVLRNTRRLSDIKKNYYIQPEFHPIVILL